MTLQELDQEILNRKQELEDPSRKEALEFMKSFLDKNKTDNIADFIDIDIWEFIKCSLYINCDEKDINKYDRLIEQYKDFFESLKPSSIDSLFGIFLAYLNAGKMNDLIDYFKAEGLVAEYKSLSSLIDVSTTGTFRVAQIKKALKNDGVDFIPFLEALKTNGSQLMKEISFYTIYSKVRESLSHTVFEVHANPKNQREYDEIKVNVLTRYLEYDYDIPAIVNKMGTVKTYASECERIDRNTQREITGMDTSRKALEKELNKPFIVMYREIIKGIKSPKIKYHFLHYIREHNEAYALELQEELNRLKQDSKVSIQALLNDYGIPKGSYDYETLPTYTKEELKTILKVISNLSISNEEKLRIIRTTSINRINSLKDYLDRSILSTEYVSNNTYILDEDSKELDYFKENLDLLKSLNIPLQIFSNSIGILMSESSRIRNNIDILNTYNLLPSLIKTSDFGFLLSDDLAPVIDKYLELGFEEYLESDLNLLNKTELERIEVLNTIGIPITSREELERYLDKDFFIPKEEIKNYLPDDLKYVIEPTNVISKEKLEEYKASSRVYDFNGIKISIQKVNRLTDEGKSLFQAIIDNTNLTEEELLEIIKIIQTDKPMELKRTSEN